MSLLGIASMAGSVVAIGGALNTKSNSKRIGLGLGGLALLAFGCYEVFGKERSLLQPGQVTTLSSGQALTQAECGTLLDGGIDLTNVRLDTTRVLFLDQAHLSSQSWKQIVALNPKCLKLVECTGLDAESLTSLKQVDQFEALYLGLISDVDQVFEGLKELKQLKALGLLSMSVTDQHMMHLESLTDLRFLSLDDLPITREGLKGVSKLELLKELRLYELPIGVGSLESLALPRTLHTFWCHKIFLHDADLKCLEGLDHLEQVLLVGNRYLNDKGLEVLPSLPKLRRVSIGGNPHLTMRSAELLKQCPKLEDGFIVIDGETIHVRSSS